ncbi:MAG: nicotinate (nicotinamide) nucleotide adenylyltransferase [Salibacteraceae bacterium]
MKKIGLYFGTFNPIHVGHLIIANHIANHTALDEVWLVVSPQNPLKEKSSLLADYHRLALVRMAVEDNRKLKASDIEFKLERPSYTTHTLAHLKEQHPEFEFALIMGEDNLRTLHKWKNHEVLLEHYQIYVYPRAYTLDELELAPKSENRFKDHPSIHLIEGVQVMNISSSFIRQSIKNRQDVRYLLTEPVHQYVEEMNFYKK